MRRFISLQLVVISIGCLIPVTGRTPSTGHWISVGDGYSVVGATSEELEVLAEVSIEFREADLQLPRELAVVFSGKPEDCGGNAGIYAYEKQKVTFCRPLGREWRTLRKLVRHEMGHAWDDLNMTVKRRNHYTAKIGKSGEWLDERVPHDDRPGEKFAGTVAGLVQGLIERSEFDELIGPR